METISNDIGKGALNLSSGHYCLHDLELNARRNIYLALWFVSNRFNDLLVALFNVKDMVFNF